MAAASIYLDRLVDDYYGSIEKWVTREIMVPMAYHESTSKKCVLKLLRAHKVVPEEVSNTTLLRGSRS
jgi:hypothetical protein